MGKSYEAKDITVLEGLEPVRKNPAMWIGSVDKRGLHHCLWELLDNAVDEVINGYANAVEVILEKDLGTVTVIDNGRGIPVDKHPKFKKSALEVILTMLHSGGKFNDDNYFHSGGLHGVGSSVVNALSEKLVVFVKRQGVLYRQAYRRGKPTGPVKKLDKKTRGSGTEITFTPDNQVFESTKFDARLIVERLEAKAYLHRGMKVIFRNKATKEVTTFQYDGGIVEYLGACLKKGEKRRTHELPFYSMVDGEPKIEVAISWTDSTDTELRSFANGIYTSSGGTHESGLKSGLVKAVKTYIESHNLSPRNLKISSEDIREGLVAILSVYLRDPQFQGQTKDRLNNTQMTQLVDSAVRTALEQFFHENKSVAESVVARIILAARARAASREASSKITRKARTQGRLNLPGKLADCASTDASICELFIVEGNSAGGNAKQARDRKTQAVLPLRGKVLNVEQATQKKIFENKELTDILLALGCGTGADFNASRLRYHKICLLMDADSDGNHITTLLLTFFYRHLSELIRLGHVYLCQPPLYRVRLGKQTHWVADDQEKDKLLARLNGKKPSVQRFKGLGEMSAEELGRTTMNKDSRSLLRVVIDNELYTEQTVSELMGKDPASRFRFIMDRADDANMDELDI